MVRAVGQAEGLVGVHLNVVLDRHGLQIRVGGEVGLQVYVHLAVGLHLVAVGVLKVDVHGQHAVVGGHILRAEQGLFGVGVVLAVLLVQLGHQLGTLRHTAVRIIDADGHHAAVLQRQLRHVGRLLTLLGRVAALHGDGGQDQHVGSDKHHHRRHGQ